MDTILQDVRFGWRLLCRSPAFTIAAVLGLALGIGATSAVFSLLDRIVLRPLPYPDPEPLRVSAIETSANCSAVLGVQPILGAGFPAAPLYSRDNVVVISHRLW